jgi:hypothetical protein
VQRTTFVRQAATLSILNTQPRLPSPVSRDSVDEIAHGNLRLISAETQVASQHFPHVQVGDCDKLGETLCALGRGTGSYQGPERSLDPGMVVVAARLSDLA